MNTLDASYAAHVPAEIRSSNKARKKVLIVDDEDLIRYSLSKFLAQQGSTSLTADSGLSAIKTIEQVAPEFGQAVNIIESSQALRNTRLKNLADMQQSVSYQYGPWDAANADPRNVRPVRTGRIADPFGGMYTNTPGQTGVKMVNAPFYQWADIKNRLRPFYESKLGTAQGPTPILKEIMENTDDVISLKEAESYMSELKRVIRTEFPSKEAYQRGINKYGLSMLFPEKGKPDLIYHSHTNGGAALAGLRAPALIAFLFDDVKVAGFESCQRVIGKDGG